MDADEQTAEGQDDRAKPNSRRRALLPSQNTISSPPLETARPAMISVCVLLGGFALLSLACFSYQAYYRFVHGDNYLGIPFEWSAILGHLIRGIGSAVVCWRLAQYVRSNEGESALARRHATFWRTTAWAFATLLAYAGVLVSYNRWRDAQEKDAMFRPEFQSGRVAIPSDGIEFRPASTEPVNGFIEMKKQDSDEHFFVAPAPDITGADIASSKVEISEVFPGSQRATLHVIFTEAGARKMENLTKVHQNRPLAVLIDGRLRAAPHIYSVLSGDVQISGVFSVAEAAKLIEKGGDR